MNVYLKNPESIQLDVTELEIHHSIHIRDITSIQGVKFLNSPEQVVCLVQIRAVIEEEVPEEEAVEEEALEGEELEKAEEEKDKETTEE